KAANALAESIPGGWMAELVVLLLAQRLGIMAMRQLEYGPPVGGASGSKETRLDSSGGRPEDRGGEIDQVGTVCRTDQHIAMVKIPLCDPCLVNRLHQRQKLSKKTAGNLS